MPHHERCISRSGLIARTDCLPSTAGPVGLSRGSNHRSSGRVSPAGLTWPHSPAIPVIVICAAPTDPASGKAVPAGAEVCCPGLSRYSPGGHSPLRAEPALGTGERIWSALREARRPCSVARRTRAAFCCRPRPKTRRPSPWARRSCRVCVGCHRLVGSRWPLKIARKWSSSKNWSRQLTCAAPFAGRIRPGRAAATRTKVASCDRTAQGASACARSRKTAQEHSKTAE